MFSVGSFLDGWKTAACGAFSPSSDPFAICYNYSRGAAVLGALQSEVHLYPRDFSAMNLPWCQDFLYIPASGPQRDYMMILNPYQTNNDLGFQGVCYAIGGQIRSYWMLNYSRLGPPATQEYPWQGAAPDGRVAKYSLQYFQTSDVNWIGVMYGNGRFYEVGRNQTCYDPTNIFSGTGQIFCQANCPVGGGDEGEYGLEEDYLPDTSQTVVPNPPDSSHPVSYASYPFESGFAPVRKAVGEYDGMVFCLDTVSAATSGPEMYHKLPVDTGSVFQYGADIYYFGSFRQMKGKFRLCSETQSDAIMPWNTFTSARWDSTGADTWDYCPFITREAKPPVGSYQISCYLDEGNGLELMETRSYRVISGTTGIAGSPKRIMPDQVYCRDGQIVLYLESAKAVSLRIYDLAGREKKSIEGFYPQGLSRQDFASPKGVYILNFNGAISRLRIM